MLEDMRRKQTPPEARPYESNSVVDILKKVGAIQEGHYVYTSERHGPVYINKDELYTDPDATDEICLRFASKYRNLQIDVVAAPALGGINLSQGTARHLRRLTGRPVRSVFTEKVKGPDGVEDQVLKRGYDKKVNGRRVLIVEDLTTTGESVKKVADSVRAAAGEVVLVSVMVNRDPELVTSEAIGAPFDSLDVFKVTSFGESNCPQCTDGVPVNVDVGHGKQFLEKKATSRA